MGPRRAAGSLALVGGGEWGPGCRGFDAELLAAQRRRRGGRAARPRRRSSTPSGSASGPTAYFAEPRRRRCARCRCCTGPRPRIPRSRPSYGRRSSCTSPTARRCTCARCSRAPRCSRRSSPSYHGGGVLAASGAGATLLCDPMVDPRGGAYTVGLGVVKNLAVFPYHGTAADHLRERSIDLLPTIGGARRHRRGDRVDQDRPTAGRSRARVASRSTASTARTTYTAGDAVAGLPA